METPTRAATGFSPFTRVPQEIFDIILAHLDQTDVLAVRTTSKRNAARTHETLTNILSSSRCFDINPRGIKHVLSLSDELRPCLKTLLLEVGRADANPMGAIEDDTIPYRQALPLWKTEYLQQEENIRSDLDQALRHLKHIHCLKIGVETRDIRNRLPHLSRTEDRCDDYIKLSKDVRERLPRLSQNEKPCDENMKAEVHKDILHLEKRLHFSLHLMRAFLSSMRRTGLTCHALELKDIFAELLELPPTDSQLMAEDWPSVGCGERAQWTCC